MTRTLIARANITAADGVARKGDWVIALEQGNYRNGETYYAVTRYNPKAIGSVVFETADLIEAKAKANAEYFAGIAAERRTR